MCASSAKAELRECGGWAKTAAAALWSLTDTELVDGLHATAPSPL